MLTLVDLEGQKMSRSASMETLALPELMNMAPPKSEGMSADDIAKDVGADDAMIIIDWAQDDREVSGLSHQLYATQNTT